MANDEDRERAAEKYADYITDTPQEKYPELTAIPITQALNLSMMEMFSKATGVLAGQMENIRKWWYEWQRQIISNKWSAMTAENIKELKERGITLESQLAKYEYVPDEYTKKAVNLCDEFRMSLYKHYRSVGGKHLTRMTALAETEMMKGEEGEELEEHEA